MRPFASRSFQPFAGQDIRSLIDVQARLRADHPFLVWRPFEVERVVSAVPGGLESAVVGKHDPMLDEVPVAFVRAEPLETPARAALIEAVRAACEAALADFKCPREVIIVDEFPRATLEKVAKAELRRRLAEER